MNSFIKKKGDHVESFFLNKHRLDFIIFNLLFLSTSIKWLGVLYVSKFFDASAFIVYKTL